MNHTDYISDNERDIFVIEPNAELLASVADKLRVKGLKVSGSQTVAGFRMLRATLNFKAILIGFPNCFGRMEMMADIHLLRLGTLLPIIVNVNRPTEALRDWLKEKDCEIIDRSLLVSPMTIDATAEKLKQRIDGNAELLAEKAAGPIVRMTDRVALDYGRQKVLVDGKPVNLSASEYRILELLYRHAGEIIPDQRIKAEAIIPGPGQTHLRTYADAMTSRSVQRSIARIRHGIAHPLRGEPPGFFIKRVNGKGYRLKCTDLSPMPAKRGNKSRGPRPA